MKKKDLRVADVAYQPPEVVRSLLDDDVTEQDSKQEAHAAPPAPAYARLLASHESLYQALSELRRVSPGSFKVKWLDVLDEALDVIEHYAVNGRR